MQIGSAHGAGAYLDELFAGTGLGSRHIQHFERMEQSYLRERAVDVKDLGTRVLAYLQAADDLFDL